MLTDRLAQTRSEISDECFAEGLERVVTTIDGIADFDSIIGHKIPDDLRQALENRESLTSALATSADYTTEALRSAKPFIYAFPKVDLLFFGRTKNNLREFDFLLATVDAGQTLRTANAADLPAKKSDAVAASFASFADALVPVINNFFAARTSVNAGLVVQVSQFAVNFVRYTLSLSSSATKPGVAVVANDHSPTAVAFSQAMKSAGVPRLYLQHAEVSASFPPLNFELNVLRNAESKRIYESKGQPRGEVFVVSRFAEPFVSPQSQVERPGCQKVVIYTTGRVLPGRLAKVVEALAVNPDVSGVVVKAHPNQGSVKWPDGVQVIHEPVVEPHIALVGNSSVTIELLHRGIPVFQNFSFDPVEEDYYGFVQRGIVEHVAIKDLSLRFWANATFGYEWANKFWDAFSPPSSTSLTEAKRFNAAIRSLVQSKSKPLPLPLSGPHHKSVAVALRPWLKRAILTHAPEPVGNALRKMYREASQLRKRLRPKVRRNVTEKGTNKTSSRLDRKAVASWALFSLASSNKPAEWLISSLSLKMISPDVAIRVFEGLHRERSKSLYMLFDQMQEFTRFTALYQWLALKRLELTGVPLPASLQDFVETILADSPGHTRWTLEGLAFNACLRLNDLGALEQLLDRGMYVHVSTLSTTRRIALLSFYGKTGDFVAYSRLKEEFWRAESPLHRLKIEDLDRVVRQAETAHEVVEQRYAAAVGEGVRTEFERHVVPAYAHVRSKMRYMNVRCSNSERAEFFDLVSGALKSASPFSMVRLGDGEAYALTGLTPIFTEEDRRNRERHWWGTELDEDLRHEIRSKVEKVVGETDVLGIPSIHRFVRDTLDKSEGYLGNIQGRGVIQVLDYVRGLPDIPLVGEDRMNLGLFRSPDGLQSLLSSAKKCVIVSSAATGSLPSWIGQTTEVQTVEIPTHQRTSRNGKYLRGSAPLPYVYREADAEVRNLVQPGTLVLVAGGIIGKIFIGTAKSAGGVALDVGSVMDEWVGAGIHSLN